MPGKCKNKYKTIITEAPQVSTGFSLVHYLLRYFVAMMFMYNANEPYELDNVLTMVNQVPSDMPILIIGNFMDLNPMLENDETDRVEKISSTRTTPVYYCKGSMATGRGLNMIYKFLNVPYLFTR